MKRRTLPPVKEEETKSWRSICDSDAFVYVIVASVGALSYVNSVRGDFVHDDIPAIVTNKDVIGTNSVWRVFTNDFWGTPMSDANSHKSYRPLTTLSFRLNHVVCGLSPWWWHAVNVSLHAACCVLVARTGVAVARLQKTFAAVAALLFAVHPIHTEAVAGVVGRADVLACIFFLSSLLFYHGCPGRPYVWCSISTAALSMLAKEIGLTALLFNLAYDVYLCWKSPPSPGRRWSRRSLPGRVLRVGICLLILTAARLAMLQGSLPAFSPQDNPPAFHPSFVVRLLTFSYLAAFNWWLLLCPSSLSHDWQMGSVPLITSVCDCRNLLTGAALLALLAVTYKCILDFEVQRHPPMVTGLLLLVMPYLPASNLFFTVGFVVAERVLYIPSVGAIYLTVAGMQSVWRRSRRGQKLIILGALILASAAVAKTLVRNGDWRSKGTLLRADLAVLPHNAKLHYNFANLLKDIEDQDNAIKHYKEALRLWPSYASAHNNLGTLVVASGGAEHHFLQALKYNRDHVNAHYNLGKLYRKKNRIQESLRMLDRCITIEPGFVQAYLELFLITPDADKKGLLDKLLELEPNNWEHYILYGNWLKSRGFRLTSFHYYLEAMRLTFRVKHQDRLHRGSLHTLRVSCLLLRDLGQEARGLQMITRWHTHRSGNRAKMGSALLLRNWQLRSELSGRALLYDKRHQHAVISTCLHHSQLEISEESYKKLKELPEATKPSGPTQNLADKTRKYYTNKKSVSISTLYKPIHNKSENGVKQKICNLKKIKETDIIVSPFISEHLIKTY